MNDSCIFCAHLSKLELIYEDESVAVALHEDWAVRGHSMLIWKRHVENVGQLSEPELLHFARVYQRAERALIDVTGADRAVMLKLGIITPHLHMHIYPVSADLDRAAVLDIIEGRRRDEPDEDLVRALRKRLTSSSF